MPTVFCRSCGGRSFGDGLLTVFTPEEASYFVEDVVTAYPCREKILVALAGVALGLVLLDPGAGLLNGSLLDRVVLAACLLALWGTALSIVLAYACGERGIWRVREWLRSHMPRSFGRLEEASLTWLAFYDNRLEWGGMPRRDSGTSGAPYAAVAYAVFYGDSPYVSFSMLPQRLPDVCADASGLGEEDRRELSRFLAAQVNAARRTRSYRRSSQRSAWADDRPSRFVWGLWRITLTLVSVFLVAAGACVLVAAAAGEPALRTQTAVCLSLFMVLGGLALLDGLDGRMLSFLRSHPTRRRFRVGRMGRRRSVAG